MPAIASTKLSQDANRSLPGSSGLKNISLSEFLMILIREIPPEWYADDLDALLRLAEQLYKRRTLVPELLLAAKIPRGTHFLIGCDL